MGNRKSSRASGDGRLWAIALGLSLFVNLIGLTLVGLAAIVLAGPPKPRTTEPVEREPSVLISPDMFKTVVESTQKATPTDRKFARTSEDQRGKRPDKPAFMGERDTRATSDRPPDAEAPPLPSQKGIDPRNEDELETTESDYRDGDLANDSTAAASSPPQPPVLPTPETPPQPPVEETVEAQPPPPATPPREVLADGPNPLDVPVPKEIPGETPRDTPPAPPEKEKPDKEIAETKKPDPAEATPEKPKRSQPDPTMPGFRGYQRKTAIRGNISRNGRSSLDVVDSPLGRYQAAISRAVEREWQINCVRNRDFITPGYLTVRFFVESSGKVRSVQFVGEMETSQIQKGFTLNSIRDAEIPAMPKGVREEYAEEPLELIFNFYF